MTHIKIYQLTVDNVHLMVDGEVFILKIVLAWIHREIRRVRITQTEISYYFIDVFMLIHVVDPVFVSLHLNTQVIIDNPQVSDLKNGCYVYFNFLNWWIWSHHSNNDVVNIDYQVTEIVSVFLDIKTLSSGGLRSSPMDSNVSLIAKFHILSTWFYLVHS